MSLDRLHNLFKRQRLSREDVKQYGKSTDSIEKNSIEQKAASDNFANDALEGWESVNYDIGSLKRLDNKFMSTGSSLFYFGAVAVIVGVTLIGSYYFINNNRVSDSESKTNVEIASMEITLNEDDVLIPELIDQMEEAHVEKRVEPSKIKSDFVGVDSLRELDPKFEISELPFIDLDLKKESDREIVVAHKFAIEIYMQDFKLIDYSHYRNAPEVKTRQIILTGLPANKENEYSETQEPVWKEVEVPYMEYIDKTMRIFGSGRYKKALTRFETILETYPQDINANFYSGICLYNLKEYDLAIQQFKNCKTGGYANFDEEADWMIALCYENLNDPTARELFKKIKDQGGFYAPQASKRLENN